MTARAALPGPVGYGARPVSVDLTRGRQLLRPDRGGVDGVVAVGSRRPPGAVVVEDRLGLAHWPSGHRIVVCALAGGTGRTTLAGLIANTLAGLPYAHVHKPVGLTELTPAPLAATARRWGLDARPGEAPEPAAAAVASTPSRAVVLDRLPEPGPCRYGVVVVDAPAGMPSGLPAVVEDPAASVVLITRPDRTSLGDTADALVWMHDQELLHRGRVAVVINQAASRAEPGSRAVATALGIRCTTIHTLPAHTSLGRGQPLPSPSGLPDRVRRVINLLCLQLWTNTQPATDTPRQEHP